MLFDPFDRADQAILFGVPEAEQERAAGLPTVAGKLAERAGQFEQHGRATRRIHGAEGPGVMVVAGEHPFVVVSAGQTRDHVPDVALLFVHLEAHADHSRTRTDVVGQRQSALPLARHARPAEMGQNVRCVPRRDRQRRDAWQAGRRSRRDARSLVRCGDAGGERIAGITEDIKNGTALEAADRAVGAAGIDIAGSIAIVSRIGVEDQACGTVFFREPGLDAAKAAAVPRQHNATFNRHAELVQPRIVFRQAVVDVDPPRLPLPPRASRR